MNSIKKEVNNIVFTVDYKTELLSVILILSDKYKELVGNKMIPLQNKYIYERINDRFNKFKNHKTIKMFDNIISKHEYFNYDAPITLFLSLDDNLKCDKLNDYLFKDILESDNEIYDFINMLSDFNKDIDFEKYYNENKEEYLAFIEEIYNKHINNNFIQFLNTFFNDNSKKLYINAIPFNSMSCYSSFIDNKVYSNLGITQLSKEENLYKDWELNKGDMLLVSLHEFCHAYVNPLTKKYIEKDKLDFIIDDDMKKFAYDDKFTIINENIVRTIVLFYEKENLKEKYQYDYEKEKKLGFKYIDDLLILLNKKDNYNSFEEFYKNEVVNYFYSVNTK